MQYVSLVTLLLVIQYMIFTMMVGAARSKSGIKAPAVTGDENFERAYRVQMNTLEQLVMTLPALWLSALYFEPFVAALLGLAFFLGRALYRMGYMKSPEKRGPGFGIGFLATIGLIGTALWGMISAL
ncbi:MAG: MAPEG family protein [Gammaproteobacteria bacterium]|nr:MAPEG family protein [Gammaproteobacteria bacterium]